MKGIHIFQLSTLDNRGHGSIEERGTSVPKVVGASPTGLDFLFYYLTFKISNNLEFFYFYKIIHNNNNKNNNNKKSFI
jgi:hypothetical protein